MKVLIVNINQYKEGGKAKLYNFPYLKDTKFLKTFDTSKLKQQFINITVLDNKDNFIQSISGKIINGNINLNGDSAMRRTASFNFLADEYKNDLTDIDNLLSLNKRVEILIGFSNLSNEYKDYPVLWFPQGVFLITGVSLTRGLNGVTISLTLHDKMALLNGECGGVLPAAINFHELEDEDEYGNITIKNPTIKQIIMELINHWGQQQQRKIIINDLQDTIKQVLKWNGDSDTPLYVYESTNLASSNKRDILTSCFKTSYNKLNIKNLPAVETVLKTLVKDYINQNEIKKNQRAIKSLTSILNNIEKQNETFQKENQELQQLQKQLDAYYRNTPENAAALLQNLENKINFFYQTYWQKIYNEYIQKNEPILKWITKTNRNREKIQYILNEAKTLKTKVSTIKNMTDTRKPKLQWINKQGQIITQTDINVTPEMALGALLMQPIRTTSGLNKDLIGKSFLVSDYNTTSSLLSNIANEIKKIKNKTKQTDQDKNTLQVLQSFQNIFQEYISKNNHTAVLIRTSEYGNVYLEFYKEATKKGQTKVDIKRISNANRAKLNLIFFDTLYKQNDIRNNIKKGQVDYNSFYCCFPKLFELQTLFPYISDRIDNTVVPKIINIFFDNKITKTEVVALCDTIINICDYIINNVEKVQDYYNSIIKDWTDIREKAFQDKIFENKSLTFNEYIQKEMKELLEIINHLPESVNNIRLRNKAKEKFNQLNTSIKLIQKEIKAINFYTLDATDILSVIKNILDLKTNDSFAYKLKNEYIPFFRNRNIQMPKASKSFNEKIQLTKNKINQITLKTQNYIKKMLEKNINILSQQKQKTLRNQYKKFETEQNNLNEKFITELNTTLNSIAAKNTKLINKNAAAIDKQQTFQSLDSLSRIQTSKLQQALGIDVEKLQKLQTSSPLNIQPIEYILAQNQDNIKNIQKLIKEASQAVQQQTSEMLYKTAVSISEEIKNTISKYKQTLESLKEVENKAYIKVFQNLSKNAFENAIIYSKFLTIPAAPGFSINLYYPNIWEKFSAIYKAEQKLIHTYNSGEDIGYTLVDFRYPGTLTANAGQTIVSVLDKIKNILGNFEYFYDINGNFVFQEIKNYANTSYATTVLKNNISPDYEYNTTSGKCVYDFSNSEIIQSYSNAPQYQKIKNDFVIWGERKTPSGTVYPIRYHLAIDSKNVYKTKFYMDAPFETLELQNPITHEDYKYKKDFPEEGQVNKIYYAKCENKFYEWFEEDTSQFIGYRVLINQVLKDNCKIFLNKEAFPNFKSLTPQNKKYLYYAKNSDTLYKCGNTQYIEVFSYRLKTCPVLNDFTNSSNLIPNKYYYIKEKNGIYQYNGQSFMRKNFKVYQAQDYRTELFLQGIEDETNGLNTNYYYTQLKNQWPKLYDILNGKFYYGTDKHNISQMDFFLDLLSSNSYIQKYNIENIGRRTTTITNNAINCIFEPECQEFFFLNKNPDINRNQSAADQNLESVKNSQQREKFRALFKTWKERQLLSSNAKLFEIDNQDYQNIVNGGTARSAYEEIRSVLAQYISYNEQVSLTILPIYYLEPNTLIFINDLASGIYGNYLIKSFSIPLNVTDTMTLSCTKVPEKI